MQKEKIKKNKKGFVILFTVALSSIILAITMSVIEISFKEINFSTEAKDTNDAFFAADAGAECVLFNDKLDSNSFVELGGSGKVTCLGNDITLTGTYPSWTFVIPNLGNNGASCAVVSVNKSGSCGFNTCIVSKGYNKGSPTCTTTTNTIERQLELSY